MAAKKIMPEEYATEVMEFRIDRTVFTGDRYDALRQQIDQREEGILPLYPAIGQGLKLINGMAGTWPAGPTYNRLHPALDFAGPALRDDLLQLKDVTEEDLLALSRPGRTIEILTGPKVGVPMAEEMYRRAVAGMEANNGRYTVIKPLGPADWLEPLRDLFIKNKVDLANYAYGFMDEFRKGTGLVPRDHPLSFRGMIEDEFVNPLVAHCGLNPENVLIPDVSNPGYYYEYLLERGVDDIHGGIGWGAHYAFVDGSTGLVWELTNALDHIEVCVRVLTFLEMSQMGIMQVTLDAISDAQTALHSGGGNWFEALTEANSIGLREILLADRLSTWLDGFVEDDQTWQRWVGHIPSCLTKFTGLFPCTVVNAFTDVAFHYASQVAQKPRAALH